VPAGKKVGDVLSEVEVRNIYDKKNKNTPDILDGSRIFRRPFFPGPAKKKLRPGKRNGE